jgi:AraC-like DNA-binding protein
MDLRGKFLYFSDMKEVYLLSNKVAIQTARRTHCEPDWAWDNKKRMFSDCDLWVVNNGKGYLKTPHGGFDLKPGSCFILRPGEHYQGKTDEKKPLEIVHIHFDYLKNEKRCVDYSKFNFQPFYREVQEMAFFDSLLSRIISLELEGKKYLANEWLRFALLELMRQDTLPKLVGIEQEQEKEINQICDEIIRKPGACLSVEELAKQLYYTPDHFSRLFKKFKGLTPRNFILKIKIDEAKHLLRSSAYSIGRIADLLGYNDVYFFSRQFKEKTGSTPSQYRHGK